MCDVMNSDEYRAESRTTPPSLFYPAFEADNLQFWKNDIQQNLQRTPIVEDHPRMVLIIGLQIFSTVAHCK